MSDKAEKPSDIRTYLIAGGTAGMVARTCVAPIERIKIIFQVTHGSTATSYLGIAPHIIRTQGILAFWKGNVAAVIRVVPYMSISFLVYEESKKALLSNLSVEPNAVSVVAGAISGVAAVTSTYPLDVVRARLALQLEGMVASHYTGVSNALISIAREEGLSALYKGMNTTLYGAAAYQGMKFGVYETCKSIVRRTLKVSEEDIPGHLRVSSGAFAALIAQSVVYPFDVIRRRNQAHVGSSPRYKSPLHGFTTIIREEGIRRGLYRGLTLNFMKSIPNVAIYMSLYDYLKLKVFGAK